MDLRRYLPTDEMMSDFEELSKLTSEKDKTEFYARRQEKYNQKSMEEKELFKKKTLESFRNMSDRLDELTEIVRLCEMEGVLSLKYA